MKRVGFWRKSLEGIKFHDGRVGGTVAQRVALFRQRQGANDIRDIPECLNKDRREACEYDFKLFCESYFPDEFTLDWSPDHLKVIEKIERVVLRGELYAIAMPRGSGKTTLCERASLWATIYGHRRYVVFIGSDQGSAERSLESLKIDLELNERLLSDFPEICIPFAQMEGIAQRANSQTYRGRMTYISSKKDKVVFPSIEGYPKTAGIILECRGITSRIRGMKHKTSDGDSIRPDLCIIDDPQTDSSASSPSQNDSRLSLLNGAILNLAGPETQISAIMPCTVIKRGDMADQVLNRKNCPRWQGDRMKAVYKFPTNEKLWEQYAEVWREGLANEDGGQAGNDFYKLHRDEMDDGAKVAWESRIAPNCLSALQTCMNMKIEDEPTFLAEMQNEPPDPLEDPDNSLSIEGLSTRCRNTGKGIVPIEASQLIAFIDVGSQSGLAWAILAVDDNYGGTIVNYGIKDVPYKKSGVDPKVAIWDKLTELCSELDVEYRTEGDSSLRLSRLGVDAGWESDMIYRFCRESEHKGIIVPTKGAFVKPMSKLYGLNDKGSIKGQEWVYSHVKSATRPVRLFRFNVNWWKTFTFNRLRASMGGKGAFGFYGKKDYHRELFNHLTSEHRQKALVEGKIFDIWGLRPNRANHLWDCIVGCSVLANFCGVDTMMQGRADISTRGRRKKKVYV